MKSKLTFLNEEDAGFVIDIEPTPENEGVEKPPFNVVISMRNPEKIPQQAEDPRDTIFMEIATDAINKMMSVPEVFNVSTEGFDIHVMDEDTPTDVKDMPGFMMGAGGEA
jgi:hypothetical protein|tara:strand:- start:99 stop:428 length:330 start_codon:yes stop_codon:yes gene_type:complete